MSEIHFKLLIALVFPFLLSIILSIIIWIKMKNIIISQILMNFYIAFFSLNQTIFSKLFELIHCENFKFDGYSEGNYLLNYLGIECYDNSHYLWIFLIIMPSFFFYGILVPTSTILFSHYKKNELKSERNIIRYDFLMRQAYSWKNSSIWFILFIICLFKRNNN